MRCLLYAVFVLIAGCATNGSQTTTAPSVTASEEEPPIAKRIYFFQHRLISKWVFESEGMFYADLLHGNIGQLLAAAEEIVTAEYAEGISVKFQEGKDAVLITFPEPDAPPNCYYAIVQKLGDDFRYITYEKSISFTDDDYFGVVGGWNSEGGHENFGPRKYRSAEDFVADVLGGQ